MMMMMLPERPVIMKFVLEVNESSPNGQISKESERDNWDSRFHDEVIEET